jgi:hypothetical protein
MRMALASDHAAIDRLSEHKLTLRDPNHRPAI